jgi:hypothetical protein
VATEVLWSEEEALGYIMEFKPLEGVAMTSPSPVPQPKVFVSYSHDSEEHVDRVLALCDRLRQDGIDADVDQYAPAPSEGWPLWMERQIQAADFVLLVCTETYRRRFDGKEESGRGLGAAWEGAIVTQAIYETAGANSKFIPVTLSAGDETHIPIPLRRTTFYQLNTPNGYEGLYRRLTNQPAAPKPALGLIHSLPPRPRAASFSPALDPLKGKAPPAPGKGASTGEASAPRRQRGAIIFSASLGIAVIIVLTIIMALRNVPAPEKVRRRAVPLVPQLAAATSLSWSPDNSELLVVGTRNSMDDNHLLRYSLDGRLVSEVVNPPDGVRVERPASAQTVGDEFVVKDEDVFVWLTEQYRPHQTRDLLTQSSNGDSFEAAFDWILAGGKLFAFGDVKKGERDASVGDDLSQEKWERGVVDLPLDSPSNFDMVRSVAQNSRLSGLYLMGYPHLAKVEETAYFLEMKDPPEIVRLRPEEWNTSIFQIHLNGFEGMPDFSGKRGQEADRLFEGSAEIAGLYGWKDLLFVLSKCPTVPGIPTKWFLTGFDPMSKQQLYTVSLPAASPHVTVAPGRDHWAILERGTAQPGKNRRMCHKVYSLILVAASEIESIKSPLRVDNSLPLCSRLATWNADPPGWSFK